MTHTNTQQQQQHNTNQDETSRSILISPGVGRAPSSVPHYPPPEEIEDDVNEEGERVVEGASPALVAHHINHTPKLVFVERAGQLT